MKGIPGTPGSAVAGGTIVSVRSLLVLACAIVLADTVFYAALTPLVPYFSQELGLSKSAVGILSGSFGAGVLLGSAPGAYLAARAGVKPAALGGLALLASMSLLFGLADAAWQLIALRALAGVGSALSWVAAFSWIVARAPEERRGQMIGTLLSAAVVGALVGPALGGAAASFGLAPTFALVSVAGAAVFVWAAFTPAPEASRKEKLFAGFLGAVRRPDPVTGLLFIAFSPLIFSVFTVLAPLELSSLGWSAAAISAVFLAAAGIETVVHPFLGRWFDRAGFEPPVRAGLLASLAILLAFPVVGATGVPWIGATLISLLVVVGAGSFYAPIVPSTAMFSRAAKKAGVDGALAFGATNFAWAFGYTVGAPLTGALADLGGNTLSCLVMASVCLAALVLLRRVA